VKVRLALGVMILYFAGSFTGYDAARPSFGVVTTNALRFAIAAALLCILARRRIAATREIRRYLLVAGMFGVGMMAVLMGFGVDRSSATLAALVMGLEPIGITIAAAVVARDRPTRRILLGLALGFTGGAVASGALTEPLGNVPASAVIAMLTAVAAFSVYAATVRRFSQDVDPLAVAAVTQVGAGLLVIPASLLDGLDNGMVRGPITAGAIAGVAFLGLGSGTAYMLLSSVLAAIPASRFAVFMYLMPVVGVLIAWIILGDAPYLRHVVGGGLILLAVWVAERSRGPA
jgi:drug/metabolite transporter (DMT)-like permease